MNCEKTGKRLSAWLDGQVGETERLSVSQHLANCPRCAAEAEELAAVGRIYSAAATLEPSADFRAAVHRRITEALESTASPWFVSWLTLRLRPLVAVAASAAVVVLMAAGVFWAVRTEARAAPVMMCQIEGMMCDGCARQVRATLEKLPGVDRAEVDAATGKARVTLKRGAALSVNQLAAALSQTKQFQLVDISVVDDPDKSTEGR